VEKCQLCSWKGGKKVPREQGGVGEKKNGAGQGENCRGVTRREAAKGANSSGTRKGGRRGPSKIPTWLRNGQAVDQKKREKGETVQGKVLGENERGGKRDLWGK